MPMQQSDYLLDYLLVIVRSMLWLAACMEAGARYCSLMGGDGSCSGAAAARQAVHPFWHVCSTWDTGQKLHGGTHSAPICIPVEEVRGAEM